MKFDPTNLRPFDIVELYSDSLTGYWFIEPDILISASRSKQVDVKNIKNVYRISDKKLCLNYFVNRTNVLRNNPQLLDLVWSSSGTILINKRRVSISLRGRIEIDGEETDMLAVDIADHIIENPKTYRFSSLGQISEQDKDKLLMLKQYDMEHIHTPFDSDVYIDL